jgi:hypothetical protein
METRLPRQSYPDYYLDLSDRNRSFDHLAAYDAAQVGLDTGEHPSRVWIVLVSGNYFDRVLAFIVYQATPRDPLVLAGVVLAMLLLGLLATWIPAQHALSIDPAILLREE